MRRTTLVSLLALLAGCGAASDADTGEAANTFRPGGGGGGIIRPLPPIFTDWVAPPANLTQSFNPQDCNNHIPPPWGALGGTQGCAASLANGQILLDWTWQDGGAPPLSIDLGKPDGYRIYAALAGNPPVKWDDQTSGSDWTVKAVNAGPQGIQTCFTVRAYKGAVESAGSNPVCMIGSGKQALQSVTLSPAAERSLNTGGGDEFSTGETGPAPGQVRVGFHHHFDSEVIGPNNYFYWDWRAGVRFDLGPLQGHPILSATLRMHQVTLDDPGEGAIATCLQEVGYALEDFMNVADGTKLDDDVMYSVDQSNPNPTLDVTPMVRAWIQGARPNNGFALDNRTYGYAEDSNNCESTFDQLYLDVKYF
jgi:hypothetical protein